MSGTPLSTFLRRVLDAGARGQAAFETPVLVWEAPPQQTEEQVLMTQTGTLDSLVRTDEPLVYEVKKGAGNAFSMGVTLGRTPNNDLRLDARSVSRFHAYFQKDGTSWKVVDADSKVGTWLDGLKLTANQPAICKSRCRLRFGEVDLLFFEPDPFMEYAAAWRRK